MAGKKRSYEEVLVNWSMRTTESRADMAQTADENHDMTRGCRAEEVTESYRKQDDSLGRLRARQFPKLTPWSSYGGGSNGPCYPRSSCRELTNLLGLLLPSQWRCRSRWGNRQPRFMVVGAPGAWLAMFPCPLEENATGPFSGGVSSALGAIGAPRCSGPGPSSGQLLRLFDCRSSWEASVWVNYSYFAPAGSTRGCCVSWLAPLASERHDQVGSMKGTCSSLPEPRRCFPRPKGADVNGRSALCRRDRFFVCTRPQTSTYLAISSFATRRSTF